MAEDQLEALVLPQVHRGRLPSTGQVVDCFSARGSRRRNPSREVFEYPEDGNDGTEVLSDASCMHLTSQPSTWDFKLSNLMPHA